MINCNIRNRVLLDSWTDGRGSSVQEPERFDPRFSTKEQINAIPTKVVEGKAVYPYSTDQFGMYLDFESTGIYLYCEDDFLNMDNELAQKYYERYLSYFGRISLNHLLNFPPKLQKLVERKSLRTPTLQYLYAAYVAHEIALRVLDKKSSDPTVKSISRRPINEAVIHDLEFVELVAHGIIDDDTPNFILSLLGMCGRRYKPSSVSSEPLLKALVDLLLTSPLSVDYYPAATVTEPFFIVDRMKATVTNAGSKNPKKVKITPDRVFKSLPPVSELMLEVDRMINVSNIIKERKNTSDVGIDFYMERNGLEGLPTVVMRPTNPLYVEELNSLISENRYDIFQDTKFDASSDLRLLADLMDHENLFRFEIGSKRIEGRPWDAARIKAYLADTDYGSRMNGRMLDVVSHISPQLENLLWIIVMLNREGSVFAGNKFLWDKSIASYLEDSGNMRKIVKGLNALAHIAKFVGETIQGLDAFLPNSNIVTALTTTKGMDGANAKVILSDIEERIDPKAIDDGSEEAPFTLGYFDLSLLKTCHEKSESTKV